MKVKCIDTSCYGDYLTIGKTYEIIDEYENDYQIIDDENDEDWFPKDWFKPLSEIRNEIINKLLE